MRPRHHVPSAAARALVASGRLADNERGAALVLALMILVTLAGLALALLSMSGFEPQISSNHSRTIRARRDGASCTTSPMRNRPRPCTISRRVPSGCFSALWTRIAVPIEWSS